MKQVIFYILVWLIPVSALSQNNLQRPKLVVGVVLDQMRWDYLYRFYDRYSNDGFKRLIREGFSCENTFIPYTPTHTAPGHSCVYTGSVPALHGIVGNNWYDKQLKRIVYCTEDNSVQTVGANSTAGKMSPKNLWSTTITDELHIANNFRNKTISIAMKDRASILPGGHTANASYWFDNASGGWITSTYYMKELPQWVQDFNAKKLPDGYMQKPWNTLYPIESYVQSSRDSNSYEGRMPGEDFIFPHRTDTITVNRYEAFRTSPSGNTFTFDMARAAIEAEGLGARSLTDFLALSFSSTDHIGHTFGPNSIEVEDAYLRFDKDLGDFLKYLDKKLGKGNYLLFLTSDHAAAQSLGFLRDNKLPAGSADQSTMRRQVNDTLEKKFGVKNIIAQNINYQIYFNDSVLIKNNIDKKLVKEFLIGFYMKNPGVVNVVDLSDLANATLQPQVKMALTNGYNQKLSGDLQIVLRPQWFETWQTGTTHGQWNPYDAHIPLLWFGWKIKPGKLNREVYMTDITPTLAALLHIQMPSACIGKVIEEVAR